MNLDLSIQAFLPPLTLSREEGFDQFRDVLDALRRTDLCQNGWRTATPREPGDVSGLDPLAQPEAALEWFVERDAMIGPQDPPINGYSVYASDPKAGGGEKGLYDVQMTWNSQMLRSTLVIDVWKDHPSLGTAPGLYLEAIAAVVRWMRPQHVMALPTRYLVDHWPLDRLRLGVGWLGWVPFALDASAVPEAAQLQPLEGGTLITGQPGFWQGTDQDAVAAAQALDIRLNQLGVLPSHVELAEGTWGQDR